MEKGQQKFGVSNLEYDMVTTLSNLLQAEEVLTKYSSDADQAGDQEVAQIFRMIQENNRQAATQLRDKLAKAMKAA
jgi:rubrerythrin